jgi:hypothetical protein
VAERSGFVGCDRTTSITVLRLLRLTSPADFADWYTASRAYTRHVADGMGFDGVDAIDGTRVADRLRTDHTALSPPEARSVAATLLADGAFSEPYCEWLPAWYELALIMPVRYGDWRLRRVAGAVAGAAGVTVTAPRFSRPQDATVDGRPALAGVSGFRDRFLLADALLHLEWFVHAAAADGIDVPPELVERTREESLSFYGGVRESLSPPVRRFQRLLFADDAWVRRVNDWYALDSRLFGLWERLLRAERERLADA